MICEYLFDFEKEIKPYLIKYIEKNYFEDKLPKKFETLFKNCTNLELLPAKIDTYNNLSLVIKISPTTIFVSEKNKFNSSEKLVLKIFYNVNCSI